MATRSKYETDIQDLQNKIAAAKGTRGGLINTKLNDLLDKERTYSLQSAQQKLDNVKAAHDWQATIHTLKNDDKRLALAGDQNLQNRAGITGKYKGKTTQAAKKQAADIKTKQAEITLAAKKLTADQKMAAAKLGMSNYQFAQTLALKKEQLGIQRERNRIQNQKNAMQIADAVTNPKSMKPITITTKHWAPIGSTEETLGMTKKGYFQGSGKMKGRWFTYVKVTMPSSQYAQQATGGIPLTEPVPLFRYLKNIGIDKDTARKIVIGKTGKDPVRKKKK
jgi:hypothetical protein